MVEHADEIERRLSAAEVAIMNIRGDADSLRSSRHEYGNWLNRHNMEIQALQLNLNEYHKGRIDILEAEVRAVLAEQDNLKAVLTTLSADFRAERWKVGIIFGLIAAIGQWILSRFQV